MSDTLFRMASGQNDQRMQAVALSTRLDYYYYQANNEDSIIFYTNKVKQFAKEIQQVQVLLFRLGQPADPILPENRKK